MKEEDFYDERYFKVWNYKYLKDPVGYIINSLAILIGDYSNSRKSAASMILKALVRDKFLDSILNDGVNVFDRNDKRVRKWKKEILSTGNCCYCGSDERLEAHHIIRWSDYPGGRIDIRNGMCLCHDCHTKQHVGEPAYHMMLAR